MKKTIFITFIMLFSALINAQETMYIMKGGVASHTIPLTEVDSLTFYAPAGGTVSVSSVSVNPTTASIAVGATQQLVATVLPANASNKSVTWSSDNAAATVSNNGLVTAVSAGTATIKVTTVDGSKIATATITVTAAPSNGCLAGLGAWGDPWFNAPTTLTKAIAGESLSITNISGSSGLWSIQSVRNFTFTAGKTYDISFDANSNATKTIAIAIRNCASGCALVGTEKTQSITSTSAKYTLTFNASSAADQILFLLGSDNNNITINNVCIKESTTPPPATCLNTNGDFASGSDNISLWTASGNLPTKTVVNGVLEITNIVSDGFDYNVSAQLAATLTQGKTYRIKLDARASGQKTVPFLIRLGATPYTGYLEYTLNLNTTSQSFDFIYTHTGTNPQILFLLGSNNQSVYLDNICITETTAPVQTGITLNVMPIGDSITQGAYRYSGSYRIKLLEQLNDLGYKVNMIGARSNTAFNNDPYSVAYSYPQFGRGVWDQDHEGYWNQTSSTVYTQMNNRQASWEAAPDIALIHLGTNNYSNPTGAKQDITNIIKLLRSKNPKVTVFVARLIPMKNNPGAINTFNNSAISGISSLSDATSKVIEVDQFTTLDVNNSSDWSDNLHPSLSGAEKMATKWLNSIKAAGF